MKKIIVMGLMGLGVFLGICEVVRGADNCPTQGEIKYESSLSNRVIGDIDISFETPEICGTSPMFSFSVDDGTCTVSLPAPFDDVSIDLSGVIVEWDEDDGEEGTTVGEVDNVEFSWTGDETVATLKGIEFSLTEIAFSESESSGTIKLKAEVTEETVIQDILYIQPATLGDVSITFDGSGTFSFDYSTLTGLEMKLKADGGSTEIASVSIASVSAAGVITDACLTALTDVDFQCAKFTASLDSLGLTFDYDIPNKDLIYKSSTGKLKLKEIEGVEGEISIDLVFEEDSASATLTADTGIEAFGFYIDGSIEFEFGYDFKMVEVSGEDLDIKRTDNEKFKLAGVSFSLKEGKIESFSCASSTLKHKMMEFVVSEVEYDSSEKALDLSATFTLPPSVALTVDGFKISEDATISITSMDISLNQAPLVLNGSAAFNTDEFSGGVTATFAGTGISADMTVGATETFNYGYAKLTVSGNVPLGSSGLVLKSISGKGGYNYYVNSSGSGQAQSGALMIGFGLGISDVGNNILLEGNTTASLGGGDVVLGIAGVVKAPANAPHYFDSSLSVNYSIVQKSVSGDITTSVTLPAGSGSMLNMENATMAYAIGGGNWSISALGVGGKLFNTVNFDASLTASSALTGLGFSGSVNGTLDYFYSKSMVYPSGFDTTTKYTADASDTVWGFGFDGSLELQLNGALNASLNSEGFSGALSATVSGASDLTVKWPGGWWWQEPELHYYSVAASGTLSLTKQGSSVRMQGRVDFSDGDESSYADLDVTI